MVKGDFGLGDAPFRPLRAIRGGSCFLSSIHSFVIAYHFEGIRGVVVIGFHYLSCDVLIREFRCRSGGS